MQSPCSKLDIESSFGHEEDAQLCEGIEHAPLTSNQLHHEVNVTWVECAEVGEGAILLFSNPVGWHEMYIS